MKKSANILLPLFILCLFSCKPKSRDNHQGNVKKEQDTTFEVSLVPLSDDSLAAIKDKLTAMSADTSGGSIPITGAVSSQKRIWMDLLKACYESDNFNKSIINNDLLYLGPSSNMYLGTIIDKKFLKNSFNVKDELKYLIAPEEFKKFAVIGESVDNCDLSKVREIHLSLDAVLSGVIAQGLTGKLGLELANWDSIKVISGNWQQDYIRESAFIRYLQDNKDNPDINYYWDLVFNKKYRIVTKVIKVSGFQADAFYKRGFAVGLSAALKNSLDVLVVNNTEEVKKDSAFAASVAFSKKNDKEIHISSKNSFYIFGMIRAGKKL